jgi:hypothetical protein
MTAHPFTVTIFDHRSARFKREVQVTLPELREMIEAQTAERKDLLPWIKFAGFGERRTKENSLRNDANVNWVTGCEADYDGERISVDQAKDIITKAGVEALIYTSPSHLPDKPRWRIVCRFSERQQPERRAQMVARLNGLFHGALAAESFTLSQSYYYGHVVDSDGNPVAHKENGAGIEIFPTEYRVELIEGQPLDLADELDRGAISKSGRAKCDRGDYAGDFVSIEELIDRIKTGESLHPSVGSIAGKYARKGWPIETCIELVGLAFTMANQPRYGGRWEECVAYIRWIYAKEQGKREPEANGTIFWHGDVDYRISRPQLIADVLPEVGCGLLAGQWGLFKTFAAFEIAHSCMSSAPFIGRDVVRKGGVLFIALEGTNEIAIRLEAVIKERGVIQGKAPFCWITSCPPLVRQEAAAEIIKIARDTERQLKDRFGMSLVLIIIDTIIAGAGFSRDGQESDAVSGQAVMNTLNKVGTAIGCFVLGIDHFGKAVETGTRGTSAKEGAADVVIAMLGDRAITGLVSNTRLALRKRRSGRAGEEYAFTAQTVDMGKDNHGQPLTSMVLDWADTPPTIVTDLEKNKSRSNRLLMRILATLIADNGVKHTPFVDGPTVRAIKLELLAAEFIRQYPTGEKDSKRRQFDRTVKAAQSSGQIASRADGLGQQWIWLS